MLIAGKDENIWEAFKIAFKMVNNQISLKHKICNSFAFKNMNSEIEKSCNLETSLAMGEDLKVLLNLNSVRAFQKAAELFIIKWISTHSEIVTYLNVNWF